jgi:hypothetical protein
MTLAKWLINVVRKMTLAKRKRNAAKQVNLAAKQLKLAAKQNAQMLLSNLLFEN